MPLINKEMRIKEQKIEEEKPIITIHPTEAKSDIQNSFPRNPSSFRKRNKEFPAVKSNSLKDEPAVPLKRIPSLEDVNHKMMTKVLGNLSQKDYERVWQGWAKNSHLGQSFDEQLNLSLVKVSNRDEGCNSLKSLNAKRGAYEPGEEFFSDDEEPSQRNQDEEDRKRVLKFIQSYENRFSSL